MNKKKSSVMEADVNTFIVKEKTEACLKVSDILNVNEHNVQIQDTEPINTFNKEKKDEDCLKEFKNRIPEKEDIEIKTSEVPDDNEIMNYENSSVNTKELDEIESSLKQYQEEIMALTKDESAHVPLSSSANERKIKNTHDRCDTPTPLCSQSSSIDLNEEIQSHVAMTKFSGPYFHLQKPDFDEFLIETEKNLSISGCGEKISTFEKIKSNNEVDDSTPGLKMFSLRSSEIEEKKVMSYNMKKQNARLNKEIDDELDLNVDKSSELSEDDRDEAIVSFNKKECEDYESSEEEMYEVKESVNLTRMDCKSYSSEGYADCSHKSENNTDELNYPKSENEDSVEFLGEMDSDYHVRSKKKKAKVLKEDSDDCSILYVDNKIYEKREKTLSDSIKNVPDSECNSLSVDKKIDEKIDEKIENNLRDSIKDAPDSECIILYVDDKIDDKRENLYNSIKDDVKPGSEENSSDSIVFIKDVPASKCIEKEPLEIDDSEKGCEESPNTEISESLPSFQRNGGFVCKSQVEESDAVREEAKMIKFHTTFPFLKPISDLSQEYGSNCTRPVDYKNERVAHDNPFDFKFEHPPMPVENNESDVFSTQDVANVCSGVFKDDASQEVRSEKDRDESSLPEFCESRQNPNDFIEMEAELSGNEESNRESGLDIVDDSEMPHSEELREDVALNHLKVPDSPTSSKRSRHSYLGLDEVERKMVKKLKSDDHPGDGSTTTEHVDDCNYDCQLTDSNI